MGELISLQEFRKKKEKDERELEEYDARAASIRRLLAIAEQHNWESDEDD